MNATYSRNDILQGLLKTLQNMLNSANNDNWDEVANYNKLRLNLSGQLQPSQPQHNIDEKQIIDELFKLDMEVIELAKKSRETAASDMNELNGRKSNVNQYLNNQFN